MVSAVTRAIGGVFSFNQMMVDRRTHMPHINASKEAMPVGIVGLSFPQLYQTCFRGSARIIHFMMDAQHFLMLIVYLMVAYQEVAPEASAHKLEDIVAFFFFYLVQEFAKDI